MNINDGEASERRIREEQADLTIIDAIPVGMTVLAADGTVLHVNQFAFDYFGLSAGDSKEGYLKQICHPGDLDRVREERRTNLLKGLPFDLEMRLLSKSGEPRWHLTQYNPLIDKNGLITRWYVTSIDIDDRKRAEEKLQKSQKELLTITDAIANPIVTLSPDGARLYANQVAWGQLELIEGDARNEGCFPGSCHPDDFAPVRDKRDAGLLQRVPFELEMRLLRNGNWRWHLSQYNPLKDDSGNIIRWYVTATDIDDRKRAEQRLRQNEQELRTITDTIRQPIVVLSPNGATLSANRVALDIVGLTIDDVNREGYAAKVFHPEDLNRFRDERSARLLAGVPFDLQMRALMKDGHYRWHIIQYNPLKDEHGQIIRWYVTATDIDDQKKTEERLRHENLVLREEIDRSSMFEEIVGSSASMSQLLKKVEKVAPADSTVLILGETGTGKELIARALHRRSKRAGRPFVKVNCAAIPQSLIASELFGHEKGAFTGALQRRVGRFEAANGGTLFLDEIGELPAETQIALLRVLQEKEFERVGSNQSISVDVRLIAATNRDLPAAVKAGTFRQDLFYRLNVVPIAVPPLRERAEDIALLVEYFVGRFAKTVGKNVRHVGKDTLKQLKGYSWPGNIRELQNVVERAVILGESETFTVDEDWLKPELETSSAREGLSTLEEREVEAIEAALAETRGRIAGPSGAAAKLGIPRQTLESKIRRLGINKLEHKRLPLG
jgi:PAS domain S-box-containing protein